MDEYRARLIEEVRRMQAREQCKQMSDEMLSLVITTDLGLPAGTPFTTEQLLMIAEYR